ncbi:glycerol-1-phosphate dehydrogenase [Terrimicrobium sacchariphilum]|uniref:Glycerol-1-phosphate dehydrogenase n=1 Tax=Terrimicrobium sacchariphilum TaxID=690879 RepID=A0A146GD19_TERSA|nr:iron-containing alcohol dehydrogenase family protein [Terrimicrobium sacchariphilum]GAT35469.1 glycerol-1-phosphate dehydrogenase [Terrimicrobium sacchariphilum]
MLNQRQTAIPTLVRVKPGALERVGIYATRHAFRRVALFYSKDIVEALHDVLTTSLVADRIAIVSQIPVESASFEDAAEFAVTLPSRVDAIIGFGGGKALDVAKYVAFLSRLPYIAVPTSLSNDGICSPQSSLTVEGKRRSFPSSMPMGVVLDTEVCLGAPAILWHSGVGDLVAKFTAVADWKLAFHAKGEPVDDFAALLSDASVYQFIGRPKHDLEGMRLLGSALLLNGISMAICGSSRPASGSEHLISHALDGLSQRPRLHGLQVGVASYLMSIIQGQGATETIAGLFDATGFWQAIESDRFDRSEWLEAARIAPTIKADFYTILSSRNCMPAIEHALATDPWLHRCFHS